LSGIGPSFLLKVSTYISGLPNNPCIKIKTYSYFPDFGIKSICESFLTILLKIVSSGELSEFFLK
jgi:hypothetical protein